ncbi:hypothetical protein LQL77_29895, partial [Rhodococcus cerastii]|nr:hypothetical protein [Rhodococcus cerastii]
MSPCPPQLLGAQSAAPPTYAPRAQPNAGSGGDSATSSLDPPHSIVSRSAKIVVWQQLLNGSKARGRA